MRCIQTGLALVLLCGPVAAVALVTEAPVTERPYETIVITAPATDARVYLGALDNFPDMYEITSHEPFTLHAVIRQMLPAPEAELIPFSLVLVRQDDRGGGVSEVARLRHDSDAWERVSDARVAMSFLESRTVSVPVAAGTYRIEISTPENLGRYWLQIGATPSSAGYIATLGHIRAVQRHFQVGWWRFFWSSYVFYPLGIALLLTGLGVTWRNRQRWFHVA